MNFSSDILRRLDQVLSELGTRPDCAGAIAVQANRLRGAPEIFSRDDDTLTVLERAGWIERSLMRPALRPPTEGGVAAGFDLGGTKLRGALVDMAGGLLCEDEESTAHRDGAALDQIDALARRLLDRAGLPVTALRQTAIGVPGAVTPSGRVSLSPNLLIPSDLPVANEMARRLGGPVIVENDANLAAFGESWRGHGRGHDAVTLAFLSFGTGVGAGLVLDGALVRGAFGSAGEIGYLPVGADPFALAAASQAGVYEDLVSSQEIRNRYGDTHSVRDIFAHSAAGDDRAREVVERLARGAALGVAAIGTLIDPALIVLGGGIGSQQSFVDRVTPLARALAPFRADIKASGLGGRAGVVGALMLALDAARRRCFAGTLGNQPSGVAA